MVFTAPMVERMSSENRGEDTLHFPSESADMMTARWVWLLDGGGDTVPSAEFPENAMSGIASSPSRWSFPEGPRRSSYRRPGYK